MIKQFRSLNQANLILLGVTAVLLRLNIFFQRPDELPVDFMEPVVKQIFSITSEYILLPAINILIALVITIIQALLINKVVNAYNVIGKSSSLPALLFITLSSLFPQFGVINPVLLCNFLLIWIISKFLRVYQGQQVLFILFDIGMIIGLGTLIYFPFIMILPIIWIGVITFRSFIWREWIIGLIGFGIVYFFLALFCFWNDTLDQFHKLWVPLKASFNTDFGINLYDYLVLLPVIFIILLGLFQLQHNFFRSSIQIRKSFQIFFFLFLLSLLSYYLQSDSYSYVYHFLLSVPTVSIFTAYFFLYEKKRWLYESLYVILVGCILFLQIF